MAVYLKLESPVARAFAPGVRTDARALLRLLKLQRFELSAVLTGDEAIRRLNREFRGKDKATDVLSFPQLDSSSQLDTSCADDAPLALGDIVISVETATRQARELRIETPDRIRTLLIHGLLHLLGYDHERSRAEARRMFAREHELAAGLAYPGGGRLENGARRNSDLDESPAAMPRVSSGALRKPSARARSRTAN